MLVCEVPPPLAPPIDRHAAPVYGVAQAAVAFVAQGGALGGSEGLHGGLAEGDLRIECPQ